MGRCVPYHSAARVAQFPAIILRGVSPPLERSSGRRSVAQWWWLVVHINFRSGARAVCERPAAGPCTLCILLRGAVAVVRLG